MTAIIYTYPADYVMASLVARSLVAVGAVPIIAIDADDPLLHVDGVRVVRTSFDRQGNLNGRDFILGNLRLMRELGEGSEWVLKVDSDTLVLSLDFLRGRDGIAVGVHTGQLQGCCYALRHSAIPAMIEEGEHTLPPSSARVMEDERTGWIAEAVGKVHFNEPSHGPTGFATWKGQSPAELRAAGVSVVNFPLRTGRTRRDLAKAMLAFL